MKTDFAGGSKLNTYGPGPWIAEYDKAVMAFRDGIYGMVLRHMHMGTLNGYVGVPQGHELYDLDYTDDKIMNLDMHGGATFAGKLKNDKRFNSAALKHPEGLWWIGFDCAHCMDFVPAMANLLKISSMGDPSKYKDFDYVVEEVEKLYEQIARSYE